MRKLSRFENLLCEFDAALRALTPPAKRTSRRNSPGESYDETSLSAEEKRHVGGLMRVNHAGEICAQALYRGQALSARNPQLKKQMREAASEETDHLAWCEQRLRDLNAKPSLLNPLWYLNSFFLGALTGLAGDLWSLGFIVETENQVSSHLQNHLQQLPAKDQKTKAILEQMYEDETEHAELAKSSGALALPVAIQKLMHRISQIMTHTSYYL